MKKFHQIWGSGEGAKSWTYAISGCSSKHFYEVGVYSPCNARDCLFQNELRLQQQHVHQISERACIKDTNINYEFIVQDISIGTKKK